MRTLGGRSGAGGRARKHGITGGMEERKAGWIYQSRAAQGWEAGGEGSIGKDRGKFEFAWEKKGGRKGGRTERRCVWKIWPEPRQKQDPSGWLEKRRRVTVTVDDGLNQNRAAQDEASRIGTKPSGVMTR